MIEQTFKDLPKSLTNLGEIGVAIGHDLIDRFWKAKAEIDRRYADVMKQQDDTSKTQQTTASSN